MPGPAVIFREIHRLRRFARDLQEQIERIPRQLKAQKAKVEHQEKVQREAQEGLKKLKVTLHEKEVTLRTTHNQIAKHEKQREKAESKKEYDALQVEITAERDTCRRLEDEILEGMGASEEQTAQLPELDKAVQQAKREYADFEKGVGARQADLTAQLHDAQAQLKTVEETLPPEVLDSYRRVVAAKGADALAAVQDRTCAACYTEITAQQKNELHAEHFVVCKSCGRILYLPA
jgi:predicted  nucleic acid-binding Zn-ribbon protein